MTTYVNQPKGIGDVIFCITLVRLFHADSKQIIWPVEWHYTDGLNRAYPDITFSRSDLSPIPTDAIFPAHYDTLRVLPLRWSAEAMQVPYEKVMRSKYDMYGLDWQTWRDNAAWDRDRQREASLMTILNLPERFALVNDTYQTDFGGKVPISVNGLPIVQMRPMNGFSLFDWAGVMEQATEIHAVSSSSLYMFELMDLKAQTHLYARDNDPTFEHVRFLFTKDYVLHPNR